MQRHAPPGGRFAAHRGSPIPTTIRNTCGITGLGRTTVYNLIAKGKLKATAVGRRRLVFCASIEALLRGEDT
jgi:excisionase family DNA binding protein